MQTTTDLAQDYASLRIERTPTLPLAGLGARLGGHVIDMLLFYASVFGALQGLKPFPDIGPWAWPFLLAFPTLNFVLILMRGQTVGKMVVGTRIVTIHDTRVRLSHVLLRYPAWLLGVFDAAFLFEGSRRPLHDRLAGTRVVTASASRLLYAT